MDRHTLITIIKLGINRYIQQQCLLPDESISLIVTYTFSFRFRSLLEYRIVPDDYPLECELLPCERSKCNACFWRTIYDISGQLTGDSTIHYILQESWNGSYGLSRITSNLSARRKNGEFRNMSTEQCIETLNELYFKEKNIQFRLRAFPMLDQDEREWITMDEYK